MLARRDLKHLIQLENMLKAESDARGIPKIATLLLERVNEGCSDQLREQADHRETVPPVRTHATRERTERMAPPP